MSRLVNQFIKGAAWGFVAFVHLALVTVLLYKLTLDCIPGTIVTRMQCLPGVGAAQCPTTCQPSGDLLFYLLVGVTALSVVLLPFGFGLFWAVKSRENPPVRR